MVFDDAIFSGDDNDNNDDDDHTDYETQFVFVFSIYLNFFFFIFFPLIGQLFGACVIFLRSAAECCAVLYNIHRYFRVSLSGDGGSRSAAHSRARFKYAREQVHRTVADDNLSRYLSRV